MNTQGAVSIFFYFYHLAFKTGNIKKPSVVYAFSPSMDRFTFLELKCKSNVRCHVAAKMNAEIGDHSGVGGREGFKSTQKVRGPRELVDLV